MQKYGKKNPKYGNKNPKYGNENPKTVVYYKGFQCKNEKICPII